MSQESPNGPEQTETESKFDTSLHPEGVRAFNKDADLKDMARPKLFGRVRTNIPTPEHPGAIDPHTHEVEVDKVPPLRKSRKGVAAIAAGAVATAILGGLGAVKMFGGDESEPGPRTEPSTSAPAAPGGEQTTPTAPEKTPGLGSEIVASVEKYPSAAEAIVPLFEQIDKYRNYYPGGVISPEQMAEHDRMFESVFGPSLHTDNVRPFLEGMEKEWREIIGYKSLTEQSIDAGYGTEMFEAHMTPTNIVQDGDNSITFTVDLSTNAHETGLDENMSPDVAAGIEGEFKASAVLAHQDGGWYIQEYYVQR